MTQRFFSVLGAVAAVWLATPDHSMANGKIEPQCREAIRVNVEDRWKADPLAIQSVEDIQEDVDPKALKALVAKGCNGDFFLFMRYCATASNPAYSSDFHGKHAANRQEFMAIVAACESEASSKAIPVTASR